MSMRLPSTGRFKPNKVVPKRAATNGEPNVTPKSASQPVPARTASLTEHEANIQAPAASQPPPESRAPLSSMPPPQLTRPTAPQAQGPEIHQSDLPESSSNVSRDLGIGPSRRRQASVAPSATSNQTGISRTGTSALIQGASTAALSGPVRGRIPSRKSLSGLPPMIAPTSSTAMAGDDSGMPPALATTSSAPPVSVTAPQAPDQPAVDFHALAASLVATIDDGPRKKSTTFLRRRGVRDPEGTGIWISKRAYRDRAGPTPPPRSRKRKKTEGVDGEDEHGENGEDQVDRENGEERVEEPSMTRVRRQVRGSAGIDGRVPVTRKRGQYGTKGKAGTTQDRRRTVKKPDRCDRKKEFTVPRIIPGMEGMRPGELLGDHVSEGLTMAALATVATQGMVSERGLKLSDHQRKEHARKKRDGILGAEKKWKMKQVQRRQLRKLRNQDRADRRRMFEERGLDPDDVSGDEDDSEEEFETQPDFLINLDREEDIRRGKESRPDPQNEEGEDEDDEGGEGSIGLELRARRDEDGDEEDGLGLDANVDRILRERAAEEENEHQNEDDDEEDEDEEETAEGEVRDGWIDAVLDEQLDEYRQRVANLRARNQSRLVGQGVIEEDEELRMINSGSFARRAPNENWSAEDTELFYKALGDIGEQPALMTKYFRRRTQRQLKNKMRKEQSQNPDRYNEALRQRSRIDSAYVQNTTGIDMSESFEKEDELLALAAKDKEKLRRRDLGLPEEVEAEMATDVMPDVDGLETLPPTQESAT